MKQPQPMHKLGLGELREHFILGSLLMLCLGLLNSCTSASKSYFDFDEVIHYHYEPSDTAVFTLYQHYNSRKNDSLAKLATILLKDAPSTLSAWQSGYRPSDYGYKAMRLRSELYPELNEIFAYSPENDSLWAAACEPIYRDILIFKKRGEINGLAKLCFQCNEHFFLGNQQRTENFGRSSNMRRLKRILGY